MERERRSPSGLIAASMLAVLVSAFLENAGGVAGTLYEGSLCFHEESQLRGVCKLLPYCSWAVKERRSGLYPQTCSFDGYMPVVCCPYTRTHDPPHLPLRPHRPATDIPALLLAGVTFSSSSPPTEESPGAPETPSEPSPPEQQEEGAQQQQEGAQQQQEGAQQQQEAQQQQGELGGTQAFAGPEQFQAGVLGPLKPRPTPLPTEPDHLKEEVGGLFNALDRLGASTDASADSTAATSADPDASGASTSTGAPPEQDTETSIQLGDGSPAFAHGR